ncbi:MAG: glutathione peroxidase [Sphingobacteriales bacterium]|nr:MAG: glutathione peroxidase [Sphingobacteriales bacterium]TAF78443.1 MAG: glutathione peroxidase [Sphingobacteriales bacterium]
MFLTSCFGGGKTISKPAHMITEINSKSIFYTFKLNAIDGKVIDFAKFAGKKVLIVNTASECGYTPQYKELQKLHETFGNKVIVLAFPCDDFGGQEPGNASTIQSFCEKNYGVTFQIFQKINAKGNTISPLYQWLTNKNQNGWNEQAPTWNFCKYLINEKGELVKFFPSSINPMGKEIMDAITL